MFFRSAIHNSQLCYRSAQNAITQCFKICQCAMRNAAIADTSATHNHVRGGEYEGAQGQSRILGLANQKVCRNTFK